MEGFPGETAKASGNRGNYANLSVSELQQLLDAAGVDYRDCFEKRELVQRLREKSDGFKPYARNQLDSMLQRQLNLTTTPAAALPLFVDEQYVVNLFNANKPSVVHITALREVSGGPLGLNPMQIPQGNGSGFVWDDQGHIITNYHVVRNAKAAKVTLFNNEQFDCIVKGAEPDKDLALLQVVGRRWPWKPISLGNSSTLQTGQRVFAIGNPFGLDQTLTAGIVSGLGREVKGITGRTLRDVVQTDCAINPGNSGGPLLDSRGRLIGVNTMIYSPSGASSGVGFAIPVDTVRRVVNQLVRYGRVVRPGLGVTLLPDQVTANVMGPNIGVVVKDVLPGSGAEKAGLRGCKSDGYGKLELGDVILAANGQRTKRAEDLVAILEEQNVDDVVQLTIRRGDQSLTIPVKLLKDMGANKT